MVGGFVLYSRPLLAVLLLLVFVCGLTLLDRKGVDFATSPAGTSVPLRTMIGSFLCAELFLFVVSQRGLSVFADRYLLPLGVSLVFVLSGCMARIWRTFGPRAASAPSWAALMAVGVALSLPAVWAFHVDPLRALYPASDLPARLEAQLPTGMPVVTTVTPFFTVNRLLDPAHHYVFATDWGYDLDPAHPLADASPQRLMDHWSIDGYAKGSILDWPDVLREMPQFTLVTEAGRRPWVTNRLLTDPHLRVRHLGSSSEWYPIEFWDVERQSDSR